MNNQNDFLEGKITQNEGVVLTPPKQSANTLFHFVKKLDYLITSIKNSALFPRYYPEDIDYLEVGIKQVAYPMVCFCDINFHKLHDHIQFYGGYGIAFSKDWGLKRGIQPIQYINPKSSLRCDFGQAFNLALEDKHEDVLSDYILTHMNYIKPIEGTMIRNGKQILKNFTDECEWRFVPDVSVIELPYAVTEENLPTTEKLNKAIEKNDSCWLKFNFSDIKYIIIQRENEFEPLCNVIDQCGLAELEKKKLITKIVIWDKEKEDF